MVLSEGGTIVLNASNVHGRRGELPWFRRPKCAGCIEDSVRHQQAAVSALVPFFLRRLLDRESIPVVERELIPVVNVHSKIAEEEVRERNEADRRVPVSVLVRRRHAVVQGEGATKRTNI